MMETKETGTCPHCHNTRDAKRRKNRTWHPEHSGNGSSSLTIALAGNPNVGKSTIFNELTGGRQHVGNWPGKTIEKFVGVFRHNGYDLTIIDLPGTYSLSVYSLEEQVARDFLVREQPFAIVNVIDACNIERNLYLTAQLLEIGIPTIIVLNMIDIAEMRGLHIDTTRLSRMLHHVPVIPMTARKGRGFGRLKQALVAPHVCAPIYVRYEKEIEREIAHVSNVLEQLPEICNQYHVRWLALQLLEGDETLLAEVAATGNEAAVSAINAGRLRIQTHYGEDPEIVLTDQRYHFVNRIVQKVLTRTSSQSTTLSDRLDAILTHRIIGVPIFFAIMWVVFKMTTDVVSPLVDWSQEIINGPLTRWGIALLSIVGLSDTWIEHLAVNGIIAGVGAVLAFVPVLMMLYFALAVLDDTGYMSRAAFVMDRMMHTLGLHGKSFLPMIVGFGCTVPAIYATRTLENQKDRILTALLVPFMSCSARLPVYMLLATIFFPQYAGLVISGLYLFGLIIALMLGVVLRHILFKEKERMPFIIELPPYHVPSLKTVWLQMWDRTASFLRGATQVIMAASLILWLLTAIPTTGSGSFADTDLHTSAFAVVAKTIAPIFKPLGFGSWEASGALVTGLVAKEVIVGTMSQIYHTNEIGQESEPTNIGQDVVSIGTGFVTAIGNTIKSVPMIIGINLSDQEDETTSTGLIQAVQQNFAVSSNGHGTLAGLAFMVFVLLYTPCMASVAALKHELGNRWMWFSVVGQFVLAWFVALVIFQVGVLIGVG